jgi:hypothetical protein
MSKKKEIPESQTNSEEFQKFVNESKTIEVSETEEENLPVSFSNFQSDDMKVNQKEMEQQESACITPYYMELKKEGDAVFCKFLGFSQLQILDKETAEIRNLKTVVVATEKGIAFNSGINLISQLQRYKLKRGTPMKIVFSGRKNRTKLYDVHIIVSK